MSTNIIVSKYNNYANRVVKREASVSAYRAAMTNESIYYNINFNPGDGISTTIVLGKDFASSDRDWELSDAPDYVVVYQNGSDAVDSRWFITKFDYSRHGQYALELRRDVIADNYDAVMDSTCYIEKGVVSSRNPLIFNEESLEVNQIKKSEHLLKDRLGCPWILAYVQKNAVPTSSVTIKPPFSDVNVIDLAVPTIEDWSIYQYVSDPAKVIRSCNYYLHLTKHRTFNTNLIGKFNSDFEFESIGRGDLPDPTAYELSLSPVGYEGGDYTDEAIMGIAESTISGGADVSLLFNEIVQDKGYLKPSDVSLTLSLFEGKYVRTQDNKVYYVTFAEGAPTSTTYWLQSTETSYLATMKSALIASSAFYQVNLGNPNLFIGFRAGISRLRANISEVIDNSAISVSIPASRRGTSDALYDIFAMPYGEVSYGTYGTVTTSAEFNMTVINQIATAMTSDKVLDVQLVPYCPIQDAVFSEGHMMLTGLTEGIDYVKVKDSESTPHVYAYVHFVGSCKSTFDISYSMAVESQTSDPAVNVKLDLLKKYRLVSPNYNGQFEFSVARNEGVTKFNVDITYKPFMPYIHINPDFKGLYGDDFNDARGLICGGDFSLGQINDAFAQYQVQNKNYQAIFDRQIENLDVNNSIAMQEAKFGAVAGALQGGSSGAGAGFMASGGNPYVAAAGAVIGTATSAIGGAMDISNLGKRQAEARDYSVDMYNLSLGNVKALPYSLTKVSAFNSNNKLFPFVEVYDCTDVEKAVFIDKLKEDGMTIMAIGKPSEYSVDSRPAGWDMSLLRCQVIRFDSDLHPFEAGYEAAEAVKEELMKGVHI